MLRFSPASFLKLLATDGISVVLGAPALLALLLDHARQHLLARITAPHLRIISVSGAPLEQALKDEAEHLFGIPLHHGYGITECGPTIAQIRPGAERPDCAVGPLLPGVEARLLDSGELCVRSPGVMLGYYRDEARTREVLDEAGWFCTGDLARLDDGNLIIAGRAKDLIIRFGFNVIPEEVEAVLAAHPDVSRAAVIGKPGDAGEDILAFIVPRAGCSLQTQALAQHAAAHLASYKRPTCYIVVPDLPLTPTGKIEKRALLTIANDAACLREAV
jgi:acyl-CoA synthetase (AMP-forming)/AMP-acid ligase II